MAYDATTVDTLEFFAALYSIGVFSIAAGIILIYSGFREYRNPTAHIVRYNQQKNRAEKLKDYGIVSIIAGAAILVFSALFFLDAHHRYNNPFYPLVNESIKSEITSQLYLSTIGLIIGGIILVAGFILVAKFLGTE